MNQPSAEARQRALLILQVQAGQITATAAAQQLGLSRKTYYQWERRALAAILESQVQQAPGRPLKITDPEKEGLRRRVAELEQKVSQMTQVMELRQAVRELQATPPGVKKKLPSCKTSSNKSPPLGPRPG